MTYEWHIHDAEEGLAAESGALENKFEVDAIGSNKTGMAEEDTRG
jgi:hypothetical protein